MKTLHIVENATFIKPYIEFINKNYDFKDHNFLFLGGAKSEKIVIPKLKNVEIGLENGNFIKKFFNWFILFQKNSYKAEKIYLHGLFNPAVILFFLFQPWLLKKCNWLIWGGDLYYYQKPKLTFKSKVYEFMRAFCIKRFGGIIVYPTGDYELAKKWYKTKGKFMKCLYYPYFAVEDYLKHIDLKGEEENIIMVGNSADPTNEHLEIFETISKIEGIENYKILCPLSYGDQKHAKLVIEKGNKYFGENFRPLTDFMKSDEYYKLLSTVKVVIMGHKRQQATGNILSLIKFGKKVFIRTDISTWEFYKENGIKMFEYEKLSKKLLIPMKEEEKQQNKEAIKNNFKYNRVKDEWTAIFNEEN